MIYPELDLDSLTTFDFSKERFDKFNAAWTAVQQAYRDRYGADWERIFWDDMEKNDESKKRKGYNERIYSTGRIRLRAADVPYVPDAERKEFERRLRDVYGDRYDELVKNRIDHDPRVAELLIQDALRTGAWKELPDSLQIEYRKRTGDVS